MRIQFNKFVNKFIKGFGLTSQNISNNVLREKGRKRQSLERLLNPSLIDFIAQVQSYDYIPEVTKVALDMNMHASTVWKFMNTLLKRGLNFLGVPNLSGIGLIEASITLRKHIPYEKVFKPLLREYAPILPRGTHLKYLLPLHKAQEYLDVILENQKAEVESVNLYSYIITGKPNLKRHYNLSEGRILGNWSDLLKIIESLPKESAPRESITKAKVDEIDLYILRRLEISPFESLRKITDLLNKELKLTSSVNYIRVLRHYKNRIESKGLIYGVKLNLVKLYPINTLPLNAVLRGSTTELIRLVKILVTHPFFPEGIINPTEGEALVTGFLPITEVLSLSKFLDELIDRGLIREWSMIFLDYGSFRKLALPVKPLLTPAEELEKLKKEVTSQAIERAP